MAASRGTVSLVTLGCGRNEVDSEELAARLESAGWELADPDSVPGESDIIVVNTCGFIESAKKTSLETLVAASNAEAKVVAVGCVAERYGKRLAEALPEVDAVLSFDDYPDISQRLDDVVRGKKHESHTPRDRRRLLPIAPVDRANNSSVVAPGHGIVRQDSEAGLGGSIFLRKRLGGGGPLGDGVVAPLKLASGCDRRCSFCAIPSFRGAFISRTPDDIVAEAEWLADAGVRELILVSENSTSYGKDFGDLQALEKLLPRLTSLVSRVRISYLQPAELRPTLIEAIGGIPGVASYFDLSFQHASGPVLRRMRRFGDRERFLELLDKIRVIAPEAGMRSNFIVGFPGETEDDYGEVERFVSEARLDAVGVFGYSDEEGTEALGLPDKVEQSQIADRVARLTVISRKAMDDRAAERVGSEIEVIVKHPGRGWAAHQAPAVDGFVTLTGSSSEAGDVLRARVTGQDGANLIAEALAK
ncbi:MiaB-like tRNA modifying enzyme YliG [Catenulispora acidiphila DSM 44928]|uniref:Ribosomal protein uS12 methylthiotransferase RimO n=1 Tax=Catenulispora acidiphila (strain DSM 44928 / JCM 14897 / NBRC 102108 / NRRL B-24433 / ID139908) TaxID=479433 RepID=C7PXD4_CATAD|nr:30S ribosomal protein S12 methylthiotransferase RimO [Catenulispora acidiphila]ACU69485.1 MiaB-like tRNA modifying enzyme YliG [Catenulispora acidiphila DSM 44928]